MKEQLEKVTSDSIKKSINIEELEELTALETAVEERDSSTSATTTLLD